MMGQRWLPYAALFIGVAAISWSAILVREADAPALVIAVYRMALASVPVGVLALVQQRRAPEPITRARVLPLVVSAGFLAAHFGFWFASLQQTSVVTSVVLVAAQPIYVAIAAPLLLRERIERHVLIALAIAVIGTVTMAAEDVGDGLGTVVGDLYAVLGGACAAGYIIIGRWARPDTSWSRYVGTVYPVTAVLLVLAVLVSGDPFTGYSTKTYVMMGMLALGPQLIGHNAINWSLAFVPAVLVAMAILMEPVGTTALAALILDELPSAFEIAGSLLVMLAVYLALRPQREETIELEAGAVAVE